MLLRNLLMLVVMALLSGCLTKPLAIHHSEPFLGVGEHKVYVVSHGWHTGFVLPLSAMAEQVPQLKGRFPDVPYIEIGWGDKGFYQAKEITSGLTIKAIFWPTASVVHVVAVPERVTEYFAESNIIQLCLNDDELLSLTQFISQSLDRDDAGQIVALKQGIYGDSQFYSGVGHYYLMNTCNKWTAKGLQSVGIDISPTFKLTAGSIMGALEQFSAPCQN